MKNKIIFIFIFVAVLSASMVLMIFLVKRGSLPASTTKLETASVTEPQLPEENQQPITEPHKEILQSMTMDTDYFTVVLPPAWEKSSEGDGLPIIIADSSEVIANEKAKEIDFRTNLSINSTSLGDNLFKDYIESVKTSLIQAIPIIEITKEEQTQISGSDAYTLEIKSIQQDLNFKTVLAIFAGKENTVWAFSFNTLEESWNRYEDIFYQTVNSIAMK